MFTPEQRARVRSDLLEYAARDQRLSGAAITGSAAAGNEDKWSDIDLAFGVADPAGLEGVLSDWTSYMYEKHAALHHLDVAAGLWTYRVFLLPGALQVDLAFVQSAEFRPLASTFRLVFGTANEPRDFPSPTPGALIGLGWLYALHARSCLARMRLWQAEYMISGVRDHALALACIRHGLPAVHGRGIDRLPVKVTARYEGSLVQHMNAVELSRAFQVAVEGFQTEVQAADQELGQRLQETLASLNEQ
jgi:predicted nucleotidyltransferase